MLVTDALTTSRRKDVYALPRTDDALEYKKDVFALIIRHRRKKRLAEKLLHFWVGPYKVVKRLNYELRKPGGRKTVVVHVSQVKKFDVCRTVISDDDEPDPQAEITPLLTVIYRKCIR